MFTTKKINNCSSFRGSDQTIDTAYQTTMPTTCKDCIYFSARNCGMDTADSIVPSMDIFS
jgi:hypothetical protein